MIYYIVAKAENGDEWVYDSYGDAELATVNLEKHRVKFPEWIFRIDTVPVPEEVRTANARITPKRYAPHEKMILNAQFARDKMDHEEGYPDTDSHRTKDFTLIELFGVDARAISSEPLLCGECAAYVNRGMGYIHVKWHNKLLP